jgi:hypothetical protein
MKSIVRKQIRLAQKGKVTTTFRVHGQPVEQEKIDRWQKRPGHAQLDITVEQSASSRKLPKIDLSVADRRRIAVPTTPTLSVVSYDAFSEKGPLSPFPDHMDMDYGEGGMIMTTIDPSMPPPQSPGIESQTTRRSGQHNSFNIPSPGMNEVFETGSNYGGQSPAPFSVPPSPALSARGVPSSDGASHSSMGPPAAIQSPDPIQEAASMFQPPFSRQDTATQSTVMVVSTKTRYLQKEEEEHRQRLKAFVHQPRVGPNHPAALDTGLRLVEIYTNQGIYGSAETLIKQVIEGYQKTYGDDHPDTIDGKYLINVHIVWSGKGKQQPTALIRGKCQVSEANQYLISP